MKSTLRIILLILSFLAIREPFLGAATISIRKQIDIQPGAELTTTPAALDPYWSPTFLQNSADGNFISIANRTVSGGKQDLIITKTSSSGANLWSNSFLATAQTSFNFSDILERTNGNFVLLTSSQFYSRLQELDSSSGNVVYETDSFVGQRIISYDSGFLVGGGNSSTVLIRKLSTNYVQEWQKTYSSIEQVNLLRETSDGGFAFGANPFHVISVSKLGNTQFDKTYRGSNIQENLNDIVSLPDGYLLCGSSSSAPGYDKTSELFGLSDIWILKVSTNGVRQWDRSFGGIGYEFMSRCVRTEDGGFLLIGESTDSGISGNKTVDGDGFWILKLNSRGYKETELVVPYASTPISSLLSRGGDYLLVYAPYPTFIIHQLPLNITRRVRVSAKSEGRPYNMDYSPNLTAWSPMLLNFSGDVEFLELIGASNKFYRIWEP